MKPAAPNSRRTLYLLIAIFFLPLAAAFVLYYGGSWRPVKQTNHGQLYTPARPLPESPAGLRGKWMLVYAGNGRCDEDCRRTLVFIRQTRLSLNNEMTRVGRSFLATADCCDRDYLAREHEGLAVFDVTSDPALAALLEQIPTPDRQHSIFLVDPLGNLVMRFDSREPPRGLLTDLRKLLKLSHIG
jgi:hypothetical protein